MSESELKAAVLETLALAGYEAWSNAQGGRRHRMGLGVGSADIIAIARNGRFVGLELKLPGAKPQKHEMHQAEWRRRVNLAGGYAVVVRSTEEALREIRAAGTGGGAIERKGT